MSEQTPEATTDYSNNYSPWAFDWAGDWRIDWATYGGPYIRTPAPAMGDIAKVVNQRDFEETRKLCRLIAAAPEMLEALRDIMRVIETDNLVPESVSYMRQARAAIAKATGAA